MTKPIVFFSHSSKDEKSMRRLKELIDLKTGNSISIFLSSDGQSIPFGRNWVHKVDEALTHTSLMFVFVSPNSIQSNWIYFEAGYAYSKNIKVVPVGILGLDLAQIRPPLSLLQGFNLDKNDALGNILAVINETYQLTYNTTFENENFDYIFRNENVVGESNFLAQVRIRVRSKIEDVLLKIIAEKFEGLNLETVITKDVIRSSGLEVRAFENDANLGSIAIDGLLVQVYLPVIQDLLKINKIELQMCRAELESNYYYIEKSLRRSALLKNTSVRPAEGEQFVYKGISFLFENTGSTRSLGSVIIDTKTKNILPTLEWFTELIRILLESGVLYEKSYNEAF